VPYFMCLLIPFRARECLGLRLGAGELLRSQPTSLPLARWFESNRADQRRDPLVNARRDDPIT
jgi:hypothetical protein